MAKAMIANEEEHENFPTSSRPAELDECEDEEDDGEVDADMSLAISSEEREEEDKIGDDDDDPDGCEDEEDDGEVDADMYEVEQFKANGRHFSHNHRLSLAISSEEGEGEEEDKLSDDDDDDDNSELDECEDGEDDEEVDVDMYEVEQFKVDGRHFSHNHRLSLFISSKEEEAKMGDDDDDDDSVCRICGLPIFVSTNPAYICTKANNACKFFLHQQCALKLPPKLIHPTHRPNTHKHIFHIESRSSTKFMTYECGDCDDFKIHPLVAVSGIEIKIKHNSHPLHEMVAVCKQISCECDACGKRQHGFFFACHNCNFWIHQDCTTLPNIITFAAHPYPFILAYSLPPDQVGEYCIVCGNEPLLRNNGIYFCPQTSNFAHAACGMEKFASKTNRMELMQLPDDELINPFPVSVIRRYAETMKPLRPNAHGDYSVGHDDDDKLGITNKYHNHPLILTHQVSSSSSSNNNNTKACINLACDLCTRPINPIHEVSFSFSSPILFYKCVDNDCRFIAHKICWDILPMTLKFFMPSLEDNCLARMYPDVRSYMFSSIFHCRFCHRPCNGLCYYFPNDGGDAPLILIDQLPFFFDIECMAAPATVNHASHAQHILFRTNRLMDMTPLTCCRDDSMIYDVYRCITCNYYIHIRCAMLPKRIVYHQYHHHPLHLIFATIGTGRDRDHDHEYEDSSFCEVCEEDIDHLKYWFYRCSECDQSYHINCIPAVGRLSKVKFGKTFSLPDSHIHPLKLKRMLYEHTQRCGHCRRIIQGLVDEMVFFCSLCHFWIHFSCAAAAAAAAHNTTTSHKLKLYSDFDDNPIIQRLKRNYEEYE